MADRWTQSEDELLKKIYKNNSKKTILEQIPKDWKAICRRAIRLDLHRDLLLINEDKKIRGPRKDSWSEEEKSLLKQIWTNNTKEFIKPQFKRPWSSVIYEARELGLQKNPEVVQQQRVISSKLAVKGMEDCWTSEEDTLLKKIYETGSRKDLMEKFPGRTWKAIRERSTKLGLRRDQDIVNRERMVNLTKTMQEQYGVSYSTQLESMKEKSRQTNMEKRGVAYPTQSQEVRDKVTEKVRELYGVDNVFQSEEIKKKIAQTNMENLGVPNPQQCPEIKEKTEATNLEKYGVSNPFEMVDRVKKGMMEKYGHESPMQVPELKERARETNIEKYGFPFPSQNKEIRKKLSIILQSDTVKEKQFLAYRKRGSLRQSSEEVQFYEYLKLIDPETEHHKLHPVLKNIIDFYSPKLDLWIQFDGTYWHGKKNKGLKGPQAEGIKKTIKRDKLQNKVILNLVRFWSDEIKIAQTDGSIQGLIEGRIKEKLEYLGTLNNNLDHTRFTPEILDQISKSGICISRRNQNKTQYIIDHYKKISRAEIAILLGETKRWVKRQIGILRKLGKLGKTATPACQEVSS
jgi:hypothetical protein